MKSETYIGTKMIEALSMTRGEYNNFRGWTIPSNENPNDDGFLVEYEDGYISWSPKKTFEAAYRKSGNLELGAAFKMLKLGFKVARKGWNDKNMFIYLVKGTNVDKDNLRNEAWKQLHDCDTFGDSTGVVTINSHIDMKAADGSITVGWTPSQPDILAEDWIVVL
jgi:hypothetical protein